MDTLSSKKITTVTDKVVHIEPQYLNNKEDIWMWIRNGEYGRSAQRWNALLFGVILHHLSYSSAVQVEVKVL